MPAAMPAAPANLLKVLAEDPSTFEKEIGCMTGILQIFDRHHTFTGRRYGSKRVTTVNGDALPAACKSPPHDPSNLSAYYMFQDQERERGASLDNGAGQKAYIDYTKSPQWASVKNGEFFTSPASAPPQKNTPLKFSDETAAPRLSFYFKDQPSHTSEDTTIQKDAPRHSFSVRRETPGVSAAQPRASLDGRSNDKTTTKSSSLDIRDIVRESFHKEKPRMSVDNSTKEVIAGLTHLKNLPRSSSVDGRNGYPGMRMEFPRSTSVNAQTSSRLYSDGKEATWMAESPKLFRESNAEPPRNLTNPRCSFDGNEVPRLTVELEEGPRLGSFKDDKRKSLDGQETQRPLGLNDPSKYERHAITQTGFDFRETLRAVDFKDSLRASQKGKDAHRFSVDGTRDLPRASVAPRLSVDGRDTPQREQQSLRDEYEIRRRGSNVVARLMGLEEFPSPPAEKDSREAQSKDAYSKPLSREAKLIQGLFYTPAGSPQCRERDEQSSVLEKESQGKDRLGRLEGHADGNRRVRSLSPKHHLNDGMPPLFRQQEAREALKNRLAKSKKLFGEDESLQSSIASSPSHEPLHGDMMQRLQQLRSRNSAQERKTLKQILEAIQLKGLLHPPRRKVVQAAPPVLDTNPHLVDSKPQHQHMKEQPNASPNFLLRGFEHTELEYQTTPKFGGQDSANIESRIKESSSEHNNAPKTEREASIVVMKPILMKVNGAPLTKDPDCVSSKSGSSERSVLTAVTRTSSENGGPMKIGYGKASNLGRASRAQTRGNSETRTTRQSSSPIPIPGSKLRTSPGREQHPPKPPLPIKAAFGSTSSRMPDIKSPQGRASPLKDREESKAALVTLRNQSNRDALKGRMKKPIFSDMKLQVTNTDPPKAQTAKVLAEAVKGKRPGKVSNKDTKIFETDAPGNDADRKIDASPRPATASASPRISSPGRESGSITSCSELMDTPKPCEAPAVDGAQTLNEETQVWEEECQVRVNAGAAVDQSGDSSRPDSSINSRALDSSPLNTRAKLQALKDQSLLPMENKPQKFVEGNKELGEVITPRGVSVKKSQVHESGQGVEGGEQPSPVSVLDNVLFGEEECTPSPRAGKTTAVNLQDAFEALESDRQWNELGTQKLQQLAKDSSSGAETNHLFSSSPHKDGTKEHNRLSRKRPVEILLPHDTDAMSNNRMGTSLVNRDEEIEFVRDLLVVSGLTNENWVGENFLPSRGYVINPIVLAKSERRRRRAERKALANAGNAFLKGWYKSEHEKEKEMLDRRALFDSVNELLARKLLSHVNPQPWVEMTPLRALRKPEGQTLVQEIWEELQGIPCATSDDVCDTVQSILLKDLGSRGPKWAHSATEVGELGLELERMIYKDLVEEVVNELTPSSSCRKSLKLIEGSFGPRRQLFAI